jgi:hypothetical protein
MAQPIDRLLWHECTLSGTPVRTIADGTTESVWTFPNKVLNVITNVQAMRGRDVLSNAGIEEVATHRLWFRPDVSIAVNDLVKATSGPYAGEYYRVVFVEKFDHHIEATVQLDNDSKQQGLLD